MLNFHPYVCLLVKSFCRMRQMRLQICLELRFENPNESDAIPGNDTHSDIHREDANNETVLPQRGPHDANGGAPRPVVIGWKRSLLNFLILILMRLLSHEAEPEQLALQSREIQNLYHEWHQVATARPPQWRAHDQCGDMVYRPDTFSPLCPAANRSIAPWSSILEERISKTVGRSHGSNCGIRCPHRSITSARCITWCVCSDCIVLLQRPTEDEAAAVPTLMHSFIDNGAYGARHSQPIRWNLHLYKEHSRWLTNVNNSCTPQTVNGGVMLQVPRWPRKVHVKNVFHFIFIFSFWVFILETVLFPLILKSFLNLFFLGRVGGVACWALGPGAPNIPKEAKTANWGHVCDIYIYIFIYIYIQLLHIQITCRNMPKAQVRLISIC